MGQIGIVGPDRPKAADQLSVAEQQAVFGIPDIELIAFDIARRAEHPAALVDEQPLAQAEHRRYGSRIDLFGRD